MISVQYKDVNNCRKYRYGFLLSGLLTTLLCVNLFADIAEVFNLEQMSLGQAVLTTGLDELIISNIGPSGADGVSTALPGEPEMWGMELLDSLPGASSMEIKSYGTVNAVPDQMISSIRISNLGPEGLMECDFSGIGANEITVDYFYQGQRVLSESYTAVPGITIVIQSEGENIFLPGWLKRLLGLPEDIWISLSWEDVPGGITVQTPNANVVQVTRIRMKVGDTALAAETLSRVDITAHGLTAFIMTNEWTELSRCVLCLPGDLNRDRYLNLQDIALMANHWLACSDPAEPACTWIAQQVPKSVDRSISAVISELEEVYAPGMTRQEFFDEAVPDDNGEIGMPESLHQVLDYIYDVLEAILT